MAHAPVVVDEPRAKRRDELHDVLVDAEGESMSTHVVSRAAATTRAPGYRREDVEGVRGAGRDFAVDFSREEWLRT